MTTNNRYVSAGHGSILSYTGIPLTIILSSIITHEQFQPRFFIGLFFIFSGLMIKTNDSLLSKSLSSWGVELTHRKQMQRSRKN